MSSFTYLSPETYKYFRILTNVACRHCLIIHWSNFSIFRCVFLPNIQLFSMVFYFLFNIYWSIASLLGINGFQLCLLSLCVTIWHHSFFDLLDFIWILFWVFIWLSRLQCLVLFSYSFNSFWYLWKILNRLFFFTPFIICLSRV